MEEFKRGNPLFSLCGLNYGLCSMKLGGHCLGCGQGNKPCKTARCGIEHHVEYCFQCEDYPCQIYEHADDKDSFITHRNQRADMEKVKRVGIPSYNTEQDEKVLLLNTLLSEYNSGREKNLFCIAVNLLETEEIKRILEQAKTTIGERPLREKAAYVSDLLRRMAKGKNIELKLRKE